MDSAVKIPGTEIEIGLDALIGLIPGIGDAASSLISSYFLLVAYRAGVPFPVITRMGLNIGLDALLGTVPVLGDVFDITFKANKRNVDLLSNYVNEPKRTRNISAFFVFGSAAFILLVLALGMAILLGTLSLFHSEVTTL